MSKENNDDEPKVKPQHQDLLTELRNKRKKQREELDQEAESRNIRVENAELPSSKQADSNSKIEPVPGEQPDVGAPPPPPQSSAPPPPPPPPPSRSSAPPPPPPPLSSSPLSPSLNQNEIEATQEELREGPREELTEEVAQDFFVSTETAPNKVPGKLSENAGVSEQLLSEATETGLPKTESQNYSKDSQPLGPEVDPITENIKTQIVIRQMELIRNAISELSSEEREREEIKKMGVPELSTFLKSEHGQELLAEAMKKEEFVKKLNDLEVESYKQLHSEFKDNFQNLTWERSPEKDSRVKEIKSPDGVVLAKLQETTHKQDSTTILLANGTEKVIDSYRTIDFPQELENKTGPLHLSMAVQDSKGRNISASKALYFTAHYDDSGKLTQVSTPQPIKFSGTGPDAVGYIERDGEVYTIAVTQSKYQEMMKEVAKNKGLAFDISQQVEVVAQDKVNTQEQEQKTPEKKDTEKKETAEKSPQELQNEPLIEETAGLRAQKEGHSQEVQTQSQGTIPKPPSPPNTEQKQGAAPTIPSVPNVEQTTSPPPPPPLPGTGAIPKPPSPPNTEQKQGVTPGTPLAPKTSGMQSPPPSKPADFLEQIRAGTTLKDSKIPRPSKATEVRDASKGESLAEYLEDKLNEFSRKKKPEEKLELDWADSPEEVIENLTKVVKEGYPSNQIDIALEDALKDLPHAASAPTKEQYKNMYNEVMEFAKDQPQEQKAKIVEALTPVAKKADMANQHKENLKTVLQDQSKGQSI